MLLLRPSRERDEESMLDGVTRDLRLSGRAARAGRTRGIAPVGFEAALADDDRATPDAGGEGQPGALARVGFEGGWAEEDGATREGGGGGGGGGTCGHNACLLYRWPR